MSVCELCGGASCEHDRHVRFQLPDRVYGLPDWDTIDGLWMTDRDGPGPSVMLRVPGVGDYLRALLRVTFSKGYAATFGVWVEVSEDDLKRAYDVWWEPAYAGLEIEGLLANTVEPWGLLAKPVRLAVTDPDATPYVVASPDAELNDVLSRVWPRDQLFRSLPH